MKFFTIVPLIFAAVTSSATLDVAFEECGTPAPTEDFLAVHAEYMHRAQSLRNESAVHPRQSDFATIDVYAHIIRKGPTVADGNIPQAFIVDQVAVLNKAFSPAGFKFRLINTTSTLNASWWEYNYRSQIDLDMKSTLKKGSFDSLNIYFTIPRTESGGLLFGYAYLPNTAVNAKGFAIKDGVVVHPGTLPGAAIKNYNFGITGVHEVGHWLGLLHTFDGGCDEFKGDYVTDTAAEAISTYSCDEGRDTCPGLPGVDPIHNFMDGTIHTCKTNFTDGQFERMQSMYLRYRAKKDEPRPASPIDNSGGLE